MTTSTLVKTLSMSVATFITLMLTSCGFQLRGLQAESSQPSQLYSSPKNTLQRVDISVQSTDSFTANSVRKLLANRLYTHGMTTTTSKKSRPIQEANNQYSAISIDNVAFQQLQLVGVLTEISIGISANITYRGYDKQGQPLVIRRPLNIKKSYQYDQASVTTNKQQEQAIKQWLRESLVQQVHDQLLALNNHNNNINNDSRP